MSSLSTENDDSFLPGDEIYKDDDSKNDLKSVDSSIQTCIQQIESNPFEAVRNLFYVLCTHSVASHAPSSSSAAVSVLVSELFKHMDTFDSYSDVTTRDQSVKSIEDALRGVHVYLDKIGHALDVTPPPSSSSSSSSSNIDAPSASLFVSTPLQEGHTKTRQLMALSILRSTNQPRLWKTMSSISSEFFAPIAMMTCLAECTSRPKLLLDRERYYKNSITETVIQRITNKKDPFWYNGSHLIHFCDVALYDSRAKQYTDIGRRLFNELKEKQTTTKRQASISQGPDIYNNKEGEEDYEDAKSDTSSTTRKRSKFVISDNNKEEEARKAEGRGVVSDEFETLIHRLHLFSLLYRKLPKKKEEEDGVKYNKRGQWTRHGLSSMVVFLQSFLKQQQPSTARNSLSKPQLDLIGVYISILEKVVADLKPNEKKNNNKEEEDKAIIPKVSSVVKKSSSSLIQTTTEPYAYQQQKEDQTKFFGMKESDELLGEGLHRILKDARVHAWLLPSNRGNSNKKRSFGIAQTFNFMPMLEFMEDKFQRLTRVGLTEHSPEAMDLNYMNEIKHESECLVSGFADMESDHKATWNPRILHEVYELFRELVTHYRPFIVGRQVRPHKWMVYTHRDPPPAKAATTRDSLMDHEESALIYAYLVSVRDRTRTLLSKCASKKELDQSGNSDLNALFSMFPSGAYYSHPLACNAYSWGPMALSEYHNSWGKRIHYQVQTINRTVFRKFCTMKLLRFICSPSRILLTKALQTSSEQQSFNLFLNRMIEVDSKLLLSSSFLSLKSTAASSIALSPSLYRLSSSDFMQRYIPGMARCSVGSVLTEIYQSMSYFMQLAAVLQRYYGYYTLFVCRSYADNWFESSDEPSKQWSDIVLDANTSFLKSLEIALAGVNYKGPLLSLDNKGKEEEENGCYIQPLLDVLGREFQVVEFKPARRDKKEKEEEEEENGVKDKMAFIRFVLIPLLKDILTVGHWVTARVVTRHAERDVRRRMVDQRVFQSCISLLRITLVEQTSALKASMDSYFNDLLMPKVMKKRSGTSFILKDIQMHTRGGKLPLAFTLVTDKIRNPTREMYTLIYLAATKNIWTGGLTRPTTTTTVNAASDIYGRCYHESLKHVYSLVQKTTRQTLEHSPLSSSSSSLL